MDLAIRDARPGDASAVAAVAREVWPATYKGLLPDDFIGRVVGTTYREDNLRETIAGARCFLLAITGGEVVGYLHYDEGISGAELLRLYVLPSLQRHGIGSALVAELNSRLEPGATYVALVHEGNDPALLFYERQGFEVAARVDGMARYTSVEGGVQPRTEAAGCDVLLRYAVPPRPG